MDSLAYIIFSDYGLSESDCAKICESDSCCMGFEWRKELSICTLKSRSLNGTVKTAPNNDVQFGLCLDYGKILAASQKTKKY